MKDIERLTACAPHDTLVFLEGFRGRGIATPPRTRNHNRHVAVAVVVS
jgi:hypothetical protein